VDVLYRRRVTPRRESSTGPAPRPPGARDRAARRPARPRRGRCGSPADRLLTLVVAHQQPAGRRRAGRPYWRPAGRGPDPGSSGGNLLRLGRPSAAPPATARIPLQQIPSSIHGRPSAAAALAARGPLSKPHDEHSFVPDKAMQWSPAPLFRPTNNALWNLDIAPDGRRFVVLAPPESKNEEPATVHANILLNFFDELRRRLPSN
jgi:hypothetical protein